MIISSTGTPARGCVVFDVGTYVDSRYDRSVGCGSKCSDAVCGLSGVEDGLTIEDHVKDGSSR